MVWLLLYTLHFGRWPIRNGLDVTLLGKIGELGTYSNPILFCWRKSVETQPVNCLEACVNGCILGDDCPHREHLAAASKFIQSTSMDEMLAIAEERIRKKFTQATERPSELPIWVDPPEI
jgi:hypothetical protein